MSWPTRDEVKAWAAGAVTAQQGRIFLWLPVAMGLGAAAYLELPYEPGWLWLILPSAVIMAVMILIRRVSYSAYLHNILLLLLLFSAGALVAKLRTENVRAPVISAAQDQYSVQAYVVDIISPSADKPRLLLAPISIRGLTPQETPHRLRVTLRPGAIAAANIKPGDAISVFALVNPPPSPSLPGGYDFARTAWFQGIGGVGFVPGRIEHIDSPPQNLRLKLTLGLNRARWELTRTLVAHIQPGFKDGEALGGFAAALVTGHEAYVPEPLIEDMRDSGLAHILSISGVHMAVVGGFIFFFLRGAMAAVPPLALRLPVKKIAAGASIILILIYLAISGAPAPAVRAAVVACVAFAAILFDRRALSLRALAIAALIVIGLTPEAVVQPGFQMSFCATAALLALAEAIKPDIREISVPLWVRAVQASINGAKLSLTASLVATLATTPFAIAYFNRFSLYSLLANLLEAPITAFVVMPSLAVGTVLAGTPLGWIFLRVAAGGLWLIGRIAAWTSALPHAVLTWPSAPGFVLVLATLGLIWVCLIRGKARWAGLLVASTILWWPRVTPPDIWIDPQGGNAAIRTSAGAYVLRPKVRQYGFEQWTQHYGLTALDETARDRDYICQGYGCTPLPSNPVKVGFWFSNKPPNAKRLAELCTASTLVVMRSPVGDWPCAKVSRLSAGDFRRLGAMELTRTQKGWAIKAAQPLRGNRYWSSISEAEND
ncbi:hypothetical protein ABAC460_12355 [Asticcacaulis sp. AC460]|uniref:ComEC/Rec2 family competence protein n=1 Tax=Asticcacaulis sp. AC460 TaxID=1282360 RepID=UPI0003C3C31A|nr:ComEC/Rec2 family competence protein [Asticcacaulis sp. AC460]ESQ89654.1 hypothetical protein ABAC460_12355 [Asticcacaulis sp. AC460]